MCYLNRLFVLVLMGISLIIKINPASAQNNTPPTPQEILQDYADCEAKALDLVTKIVNGDFSECDNLRRIRMEVEERYYKCSFKVPKLDLLLRPEIRILLGPIFNPQLPNLAEACTIVELNYKDLSESILAILTHYCN